MNYENSPQQKQALHLVLTKKSELNPNDKTYSHKSASGTQRG